jgi:hypothetical protein
MYGERVDVDRFKRMMESFGHESVVVAADNVVEYLCDHAIAGADLSRGMSIVPPFEVTWLESQTPYATDFREWSGRFAALIVTHDFGPATTDEEITARQEAIRDTMLPWHENQLAIGANPRWTCYALHFDWFDDSDRLVGPLCESLWLCDDDGHLQRFADGEASIGMRVVKNDDIPEHPLYDKISEATLEELNAIWSTFAFCHCKNVRIEEQEGTYPSRQARRAAERRGAAKPTKFYTLSIGPIGDKSSGQGHGANGAAAKAQHICRGHFATYTEERPLFGKYAGQFWIPAHVRGSAEAGKVFKDYDVKAPAA